MQITKAESYGLLGIIYLAQQEKDRNVPLSEIARSQDVPEKFLAKIFQYLTRSGIVRSHRGIRGGFALLKDPEKLTFCDVIEAIQGPSHLIMCIPDSTRCKKAPKCAVRTVMQDAENSMKAVFKNYAIADVI